MQSQTESKIPQQSRHHGVVRLAHGDVFGTDADVVVVPCSTSGTLSPYAAEAVQRVRAPELTTTLEWGDITVLPLPDEQVKAQEIVYAASVRGNEGSHDIIHRIGTRLGSLTGEPSRMTINAPLLGTGAGQLDFDIALEALASGFLSTAARGSCLRVFVLSLSLYQRLAAKYPDYTDAPGALLDPTARFSEDSLRVIERATREARWVGYPFVGTTHLALALLQDQSPCIRAAVGTIDLDHARDVAATIDKAKKPGSAPDRERPSGQLPRSANTRKVLDELAPAIAGELGSETVDPAHLLIALIRAPQSALSHPLFASMRIDAKALEQQLFGSLATADVRESVRWRPDNPTINDLLGRSLLAEILAQRLQRLSVDPEHSGQSFVIHLDGRWGSGKSTLLRLLSTRLDRSAWLVVEFDAWRQSHAGPAWWALLTALRRAVVGRTHWWARWTFRLRETTERVRRNVALHSLTFLIFLVLAIALFRAACTGPATDGALKTLCTLLGAAGSIGLVWGGCRVMARLLFWDSATGAGIFEKSQPRPMDQVAAHFAWLTSRSRRNVLFLVDDLDRCEPAYVVELLDAVTTVIRRTSPATSSDRRPAVFFLVSADGRWIRSSYEERFASLRESVRDIGRPLGYLFLDKIFQLTVPVPEMSRTRQANYLTYLLGTTDPVAATRLPGSPNAPDRRSTEADSLAATRASLARARNEEEAVSIFGSVDHSAQVALARDVVDRLEDLSPLSATEHFLSRYTDLMEPNPRALKRAIMAYDLTRRIRRLEGRATSRETLALWTILRLRWPEVAEHLAHHPDDVVHLGDETTEDPPAALKDLRTDPDLRAVVRSELGGPLDAAAIRDCVS
ncbi:MAG: hypothetical protein GXX79_18375 [Actinomycetales bacterium]|nr:hypothetical protein [Actinomycetales bacterium]